MRRAGDVCFSQVFRDGSGKILGLILGFYLVLDFFFKFLCDILILQFLLAQFFLRWAMPSATVTTYSFYLDTS